MSKKLKVKITQSIVLKMTREDLEELKQACFADGDRQMLNETVDDNWDTLLIEEVQSE